jgi:predicted membrane protein
VLTVFGALKKQGEWEPARHTDAVAIFSDMELDFRSARLGPGVTTIDVSCVFSEVRVIVPPGLRVECDGSTILGEFSQKSFSGSDPNDEAPTLRVTGQSVFGAVKVSMRLPSETAKEARRREKGS